MRHLILLAMCGLLTGCELLGLTDDGAGHWKVGPGVVASVVVPESVRVDEPFEVRVETYGGGCARSAGVRVEASHLEAVVTPLDSIYSPGVDEACQMILRRLVHRAALQFSEAGEARISIASAPGPRPGGEQAPALEHVVQVLP